MRDNNESRGPGGEDRRPSLTESLSDSAINRELTSKATFNPWTVLPLLPIIWAVCELLIPKRLLFTNDFVVTDYRADS